MELPEIGACRDNHESASSQKTWRRGDKEGGAEGGIECGAMRAEGSVSSIDAVNKNGVRQGRIYCDFSFLTRSDECDELFISFAAPLGVCGVADDALWALSSHTFSNSKRLFGASARILYDDGVSWTAILRGMKPGGISGLLLLITLLSYLSPWLPHSNSDLRR